MSKVVKKLPNIVKIVQNCQHGPKLSKLSHKLLAKYLPYERFNTFRCGKIREYSVAVRLFMTDRSYKWTRHPFKTIAVFAHNNRLCVDTSLWKKLVRVWFSFMSWLVFLLLAMTLHFGSITGTVTRSDQTWPKFAEMGKLIHPLLFIAHNN